jgi:hypothetical protein
MAQVQVPEFKDQYCKNKQTNKQTNKKPKTERERERERENLAKS